jgi:hypothetical protein
VLRLSRKARQRQLSNDIRLGRGWVRRHCSVLEHPSNPLDIDHVEGERALTDCLDSTRAILVAQPQQGVRLPHSLPRKRSSQNAFDVRTDVVTLGFGLNTFLGATILMQLKTAGGYAENVTD